MNSMDKTPKPFLSTKDLTLTYQDGDTQTVAIQDVSLEVPAQQFTGILGPSGSGKSSLLYLLSGLKQPTRGSVYYCGQPLAHLTDKRLSELRRQQFGFVFQQHFLLSYLTALENVWVAAPSLDDSFVQRACALFRDFGLEDKMDRFPHQLSGGERQRVAVMRAIIHQPKLLFADEPTGMLDQTMARQVINALLKQKDMGCTLIIVTHNPEMLADADVVLQVRDGMIVNLPLN
jgi:putative ABC transport system ATP-binding protein